MSRSLPIEAERYVDPTSTIASIRAMTDAVERGELEMSALLGFVKAAGNGQAPRFAKTHPVPLAILEAIRANPELPARKVVYRGVAQDLWTMDDAARYEENEARLSESRRPAVRTGVYLTRTRSRPRTVPKTEGMFVPKMDLGVYARHPAVCDGAKACLALLLSLAGKARDLVTYTSSLATTLGRTARTVRNYFASLETAGLIVRRPGKHFNTVHIAISDECRPAPYSEPVDIKAFRLARGSTNPALSMMAMAVVCAAQEASPEAFATSDRRKGISPFNLRYSSLVERTLTAATGTSGSGGQGASGGRDRDREAPTTHSTLLLDRRIPVNGHRKQGFGTARPPSVAGTRQGGGIFRPAVR